MPKVLILTTSHGASHRRASEALKKAFFALDPRLTVEITDAIDHCARWFRAYYDSYLIPLRYWPGLWRWIEGRQHQSSSTNPGWLYRYGGQPLFRYIADFKPDMVVATEVGVCELACLCKRQAGTQFFLVALELMDFNQAWIQPEADLYPVVHADFGDELVAAGAPRAKILDCGMPIDPIYEDLPERAGIRAQLDLRQDVPLLLVLFGGTGFGKPERIMAGLRDVRVPFQAVFIAGRNISLEGELRKLSGGREGWRVLGWVNNMHEWMAAADLLLSKPGGGTVMEAAACGLPLLAFDPLPGNEERTCGWLEKWQAGVWLKSSDQIASHIERLLANPDELSALRDQVKTIARPRAARQAAEGILRSLPISS